MGLAKFEFESKRFSEWFVYSYFKIITNISVNQGIVRVINKALVNSLRFVVIFDKVVGAINSILSSVTCFLWIYICTFDYITNFWVLTTKNDLSSSLMNFPFEELETIADFWTPSGKSCSRQKLIKKSIPKQPLLDVLLNSCFQRF